MDVPGESRKLFGVHPPQNNPQTKITQKERHRKLSGVFLFIQFFIFAAEPFPPVRGPKTRRSML
jgi:hypothetical protein